MSERKRSESIGAPSPAGPFSIVDLRGVPVARVTVTQFSSWLLGELVNPRPAKTQPDHGTPRFITYLNAACSNISASDTEYSAILQQADCVYADGQAIVWAAKWLGNSLPERVNAGDFITDVCQELAKCGIRVALIGGRPGVAASAAQSWQAVAPDLQVVAVENGFFDDGGTAACDAICAAGADLVLVGMGVPLQEKWAWEHRHRFGAKAIWCVGALFEYYGENRPRAPVWMRRAGLEWLFRLTLEPRRLWRRYLIGNLQFIMRVLTAESKL